MEKIHMLIESENGHDTLDISKDNVESEVKKQLKEGNWVTVEKEDGSSEVLTEKDIAADGSWKDMFKGKSTEITPIKTEYKPTPNVPTTSSTSNTKRFEKVRSITSTKPAKGG